MPVKIRFARFGLKHQPRYRIVVANSFDKRDGRHIEWIGSYNPFPDRMNMKLCQLDFERAKYWLGVGAEPTEPVQKLFSKVNSNFNLKCLLNFLGRVVTLNSKRRN
jgi:small subunit ribosomal protein S16